MRNAYRSTASAGLAVFLLLAAATHTANADTAPQQQTDDNQALRERVESLEETVSLLKRQIEVRDEADASKGSQPVIGAGPDGFFLQSADKAYQLRFRGYVQADARFFTSGDVANSNPTDDFYLYRVRPIVEGTVAQYIDFKIMPDFGQGKTVLQDAFFNARYWPLAQLQVGKFKEPFGLERLESATNLTFINRAFPTQLSPNRDIGAMLWGQWHEGLLTYQLGVFDGVVDYGSTDADNNDGKDFAGRVFVHPFQNSTWEPLQGLGIGFATTVGDENGAPPSYQTEGLQTFFKYNSTVQLSGERYRLSPQAYWYWGPFGTMFEWVESSSEMRNRFRSGLADLRATNTAWQISASYVLTGENASYGAVIPRADFSPTKGTWGAYQIAARYGELHVDDAVFDDGFANLANSAKTARELTVGLNWYLNRFLKWQLNFGHTWFDGGANGSQPGATSNRAAENVIVTRFQIQY